MPADPSTHLHVAVLEPLTIVRKGICALLNAAGTVTVEGEAETWDEASRLVRSRPVDVLIAETDPGSLPLAEGLRRIRTARPGVRVLVLTANPSPMAARTALRAGVRGYIVKSCTPADLRHALGEVHAGRIALCPDLLSRLTQDWAPVDSFPLPPAALTPRQRHVTTLLANGRSARQIAGDLAVSIKAVEAVRRRVLTRLQLSSTPDLVRYAIRHGLVPL
jgi:DNA-binding NarL/FixJ family response regulator